MEAVFRALVQERTRFTCLGWLGPAGRAGRPACGCRRVSKLLVLFWKGSVSQTDMMQNSALQDASECVKKGLCAIKMGNPGSNETQQVL